MGLSSGGSPIMTNDKRQKVLAEAKKWLGQGKVRYVLGIVIRQEVLQIAQDLLSMYLEQV